MSKLVSIFAAIILIISFSSFVNNGPAPSPSVSRSLVFPVFGKKSNIGSFWGDSRDGGSRKHQGIDIFAKKGTPVVAVADGVIVQTGNERLGGKTVWLQTTDHPWNVYYAHLDKQKVHAGQVVKKGDVLGTVGNTGNARFTPSHLHFGIYTMRGPVNPLPYVKHSPKIIQQYKSRQEEDESIAKTFPTIQPKEDAKSQESVYSFPSQYIYKTINLSQDPQSKYYVTIRQNVVRVKEGKLAVIGKWMKTNSTEYPNSIVLINNQKVFVNKVGQILSPDGSVLGNVS